MEDVESYDKQSPSHSQGLGQASDLVHGLGFGEVVSSWIISGSVVERNRKQSLGRWGMRGSGSRPWAMGLSLLRLESRQDF